VKANVLVPNASKNNKTMKNKLNFGFKESPQAGGVAPTNFRYPANMQQPSEEIMEWATTAGAPTPISGMRNVAHGGKRSTRKRSTRRHHKKSHKKSHHKKSHKKSHHKKRTLRRKSVKRNRRN
jgi:hypothetical protein